MKKQLLILSLITGMFTQAFAQMPLAKQLPGPGAKTTMKRITNAGTLSRATTGANQTWNYSTATIVNMFEYEYVGLDKVPQQLRDSFPNTDYVEVLLSGAPQYELNPMGFYEDQSDFLIRIGNKGSGSINSNTERNHDTAFYFGHPYDSTIEYRGQYTTYVGYGSLTIDGKTMDSVAMFRYTKSTNTDTVYWFYQLKPFFSRVFGYNVVADTIQGMYYYHNRVDSVPPTGVKETTASTASMYPNPATTSVRIELKKQVGTAHIAIYDVQGKQVLAQQISNSNEAVLNLSELRKGIYFVEIQTEGHKHTQKLIRN